MTNRVNANQSSHEKPHTCLLAMALCVENHYNFYFVQHMEHSQMTNRVNANQSSHEKLQKPTTISSLL